MTEKLHHSVGVDWAFPYFCFFALRKSFFLAQLVVVANLFHSGRKGTPLLVSLLIRHLGYNFLLTEHYFEIPPPVPWSRSCLAGVVLSGGSPLLLWGLDLCYVHFQVPELTCFISVFTGTVLVPVSFTSADHKVIFSGGRFFFFREEVIFWRKSPYFLNERFGGKIIVSHSLKCHHSLLLLQLHKILKCA